jgi:hypothetical protein
LHIMSALQSFVPTTQPQYHLGKTPGPNLNLEVLRLTQKLKNEGIQPSSGQVQNVFARLLLERLFVTESRSERLYGVIQERINSGSITSHDLVQMAVVKNQNSNGLQVIAGYFIPPFGSPGYGRGVAGFRADINSGVLKIDSRQEDAVYGSSLVPTLDDVRLSLSGIKAKAFPPLTPGTEQNPLKIRQLSDVTIAPNGEWIGINDISTGINPEPPTLARIVSESGSFRIVKPTPLLSSPRLDSKDTRYVQELADWEAIAFDDKGNLIASSEGNIQKDKPKQMPEDQLLPPALAKIDPKTGQVLEVVRFPDSITRKITHNHAGEALVTVPEDSILGKKGIGVLVGIETPLEGDETHSLLTANGLNSEKSLEITGSLSVQSPLPGQGLRALQRHPTDKNAYIALFTGYDSKQSGNYVVVSKLVVNADLKITRSDLFALAEPGDESRYSKLSQQGVPVIKAASVQNSYGIKTKDVYDNFESMVIVPSSENAGSYQVLLFTDANEKRDGSSNQAAAVVSVNIPAEAL